MTITKADRRKVMPADEKIKVIVDAVRNALAKFADYEKVLRQSKNNLDTTGDIITTDHLPLYRRGRVNSAVYKAVNQQKDSNMEAIFIRSGAFEYTLVKFHDCKINLLVAHLPAEKHLPLTSNIRGEHSSFNISILRFLGIEEENYPPQYVIDFDSESDKIRLELGYNVIESLENVHFGLMLFYDGKKPHLPFRLTALSPEQDRYLFTEYIMGEIGESPAKTLRLDTQTSDKVVELPKRKKRTKIQKDVVVSTEKEAEIKLKSSAKDQERNANEQS